MSEIGDWVEVEAATARKVREYAARMRAIGITPAIESDPDGGIRVTRTAPRELRAQFRDGLAAFGFGVLADVALNSTDDKNRVAAVKAMIDAGLGTARSAMDGEGELHRDGIVLFPVAPPDPQPPEALLRGEASTGWVPADTGMPLALPANPASETDETDETDDRTG